MIFKYSHIDDLQEVVDYLTKREGEFTIEVKKIHPKRSINHNRFYWAILKLISMESGNEPDYMHEYYKQKFNHKIVTIRNMPYMVAGSTAKMDSGEFTNYLTRVKEDARIEFGVNIPDDRDEQYKFWMQIENDYEKYQRTR